MSQPEQKKKSNRKARPLPIDIIRESLEIDETVPSGLRWKVRPRHHFVTGIVCETWNARFAKDSAGARKGNSIYWLIGIGGVMYRAHRVIYLLAYGIDPLDKHIDHIRADLPLPNIASNLRLATNAENMRNQRKRTDNTSNVTGICWNKHRQKWQAQIKVHGKQTHLGHFTEFADAVAARKAAEAKHFGEFAYDASQSRIASLYEHTQSRI